MRSLALLVMLAVAILVGRIAEDNGWSRYLPQNVDDAQAQGITYNVRSYLDEKGVVNSGLIADAINKYSGDLDVTLILAICEVESEWDEGAISNMGAVGLMQVRPYYSNGKSLWYDWLREKKIIKKASDLTKIEPNIRSGCAILRECLKGKTGIATALWKYNGKPQKMLSYLDLVITKQNRILKEIH